MAKDKICGIYCLTNKINGKKYIGQSKNIHDRWRSHKQATKNYVISKAIIKYGQDNFDKEILEIHNIDNLEYRYEREFFFIDKLQTWVNKNGYNVANYNDTFTLNDKILEIKAKIKNSKKAKPEDEKRTWINKDDIIKSVRISLLEEYLNNGWIKGFGKKHSDKMSKINKERWENGFKYSEESLKKMSNKGKKMSQIGIYNLKKAAIGKYTLKWFIEKYGEIDGTSKYNIKCSKCISTKSGIDWWVNRYGLEKGQFYYDYLQEYKKNKTEKKYFWVNNNLEMIVVNWKNKKEYIDDGWSAGMLKINKKK